MIVIIDNYDSFTYNLYHLIASVSSSKIDVIRNDKITVKDLTLKKPEAVFISPGPCTPNEAGISLDLISELSGKVPIFGVCLGFQSICQAFGGNIVKFTPFHGKESIITKTTLQDHILQNVPDKFKVIRYHSLGLEEKTTPKDLIITSRSTEDNLPMSVSHKTHKTFGVQFHPESIGSEHGKTIIQNFISLI